jgi:F-type H+-transporting ATPase subunit b
VELNWTTFALEILNFLILVWILQHFLYRPVLKVIAARRASIEKTLADAKAIENDAQALKTEYAGRQAAWQQEKEAARAKLAEEMAEERMRLTAALEASLAEQREKAKVLDARRCADWQRATEEQALALGAAFTSRLLARVAGAELDARLIDIALEDLGRYPADKIRGIAQGAGRGTATVTSAYVMDEAKRNRVSQALAALTGVKPAIQFKEDPQILGGLRIDAGAWVVHANLGDELKFFADVGDHGG